MKGGVNDGDGQREVVVGPTPASGGEGIARLPDGRVIFVAGALPGETVNVEITDDRKDYARGALVEVLAPSPVRIPPPCPWVARGCGGCGWQHVEVSAQVGMKQAVALDALRRIAHIDATALVAAAVLTPAVGYRTTVHLALDAEGRPAYHRRGRHDLVTVTGCAVVHPLLCDLIDNVRLAAASRVTLRVGVLRGERLVVVDHPKTRPEVSGRRGGNGGASRRTRESSRGHRQLWEGPTAVPEDALVVGPDDDAFVIEEVAGRRWQVSARSFFQSGPLAAAALAEVVDANIGALGAGDHLVDLYAGVGLLGGTVAARRPGLRLTAVESAAIAVTDASTNLADLEASVIGVEVGLWTPSRATAVIADPARPGLGRPGVKAVAATGARRLVLVSCDPASMARDAQLLNAAGYRLEGLRVVDCFPQTPHIETVARFERAP